MHPSVAYNCDEIVRWHWFSDWDGEIDNVHILFRLGVLLAQQELVVKEYLLSITVFDDDPESLRETVQFLMPLEVGRYTELYAQQ